MAVIEEHATEWADALRSLEQDFALDGRSAADNRPTCECPHDPDGIETRDWSDGWPCGKTATHLIVTECDCGRGCPDQSFYMCQPCVEGALDQGSVVSVEPL